MEDCIFIVIMIFTCTVGCQSKDVRWDVDYANFDYSDYGIITDNGPEPIRAIPQKYAVERIFEPKVSKRVRTYGWRPESQNKGPINELLFRPVMMYIDDTETFMYIADAEVPVVKKFSVDNGSHLVDFGKGPGRGPGEFYNPFDYSVMPNGKVLVADRKGARVIFFDEFGNVIGQNRKDYVVTGVKAIGNNAYICDLDSSDPKLFALYDIRGRLVKKFGKLVNDPRIRAGLVGDMRTDSRGNMVYTMVISGHILGYSTQQNVKFYRTSLAQEDFPKFIRATIPGTPKGALTFDLANHFASYHILNIWGDEFFVAILPREGFPDYSSERPAIIDAFDLSTGDYLYSLEWPEENCGIYFITDRHIYTSCGDEGLIQWERPANSFAPAISTE